MLRPSEEREKGLGARRRGEHAQERYRLGLLPPHAMLQVCKQNALERHSGGLCHAIQAPRHDNVHWRRLQGSRWRRRHCLGNGSRGCHDGRCRGRRSGSGCWAVLKDQHAHWGSNSRRLGPRLQQVTGKHQHGQETKPQANPKQPRGCAGREFIPSHGAYPHGSMVAATRARARAGRGTQWQKVPVHRGPEDGAHWGPGAGGACGPARGGGGERRRVASYWFGF